MKNLLIASALAVASILPTTAQSQAASVTVTTTERTVPRHHVRERHHRQHCTVKKMKTRHHGKVIVETTRVCR
jgi:Ni/Co efflux regulator RcnB